MDYNLYRYANNNPVNFRDAKGLAIETGWDAFNVTLDLTSLATNVYMGNWAGAAEDALGFAFDAGATAAPGIPAGAGVALKSKRALGKIQASVDSGRIWKMNHFDRGKDIEKYLDATYFRKNGWGRVGDQANGKFPLIDFHNRDLDAVLSLKTFKRQDPKDISCLKNHITDLGERPISVDGKDFGGKRLLQVVLPKGYKGFPISKLRSELCSDLVYGR